MKKSIVKKVFATALCTDKVLKRYMNIFTYNKYIRIKYEGGQLDTPTAKAVAKAMKTWALKNGVTHYTHWFAPLTGKTAEKQVSFIDIDHKGKLIEEFSAKSLIKGEADASSFPNGGERMTFEARGYSVWDYTSPAFIKENGAGNKVLYIPTAFCSYNGTALDEKTPLLRSIEALNKESVRVLKHLGMTDVKNVVCNIGGEQEYFLIKYEDFERRLDLKVTNRTLLGAKPTRSQEYYSHYFGIIDDKISEIMNKVDIELWKLGIMAKLQHNEVAPSQFELVPIFAPANISSDQNQLIMETITKVAKHYGYAALFHEKPFNYVNGSGKHINWSLSTDTGINLIDSNIENRDVFLTFFTAMIAGIDRYYKLIRCSTAHRGNDLRLGGDEAPPTLISVFVGENIEEMLNKLNDNSKRKKSILDMGVNCLPKTSKDFCDRNRTSPFAYTTNKFEFRMVGSSQTISWPITCINTIMANVLKEIADKLDEATDPKTEIKNIIKSNIEKHKRIIFNGNGYDKSWHEEAARRGLVEYRNSIDCFDILKEKDIVDLFDNTKILDASELTLRKSTYEKSYFETIKVEAKTLVELVLKNVIPNINKYIIELDTTSKSAKDSRIEIKNLLIDSLNKLSKLSTDLLALIDKLGKNNFDKELLNTSTKTMEDIRKVYDSIELYIPESTKPFPSYNDMLF
ncbi:MAG: glutamine synthetase III [Clostridia bacterium]|nr:glutamine synthetase III [Clostridia bacterium]